MFSIRTNDRCACLHLNRGDEMRSIRVLIINHQLFVRFVMRNVRWRFEIARKLLIKSYGMLNVRGDRMGYDEIMLLSSPNAIHQVILGSLYVILREYLKGSPRIVFMAPFDVHFYKPEIKAPDLLQPDLIVACDAKETIDEEGRYMGTPTLTVEISSPRTRSKDMVTKLNTYMLSEVQEYWIIDPEEKTAVVYGFKERSVVKMTQYKERDMLQSYVLSGLNIELDSVFTEI
jgi:Uma2 family endonuclease